MGRRKKARLSPWHDGLMGWHHPFVRLSLATFHFWQFPGMRRCRDHRPLGAANSRSGEDAETVRITASCRLRRLSLVDCSFLLPAVRCTEAVYSHGSFTQILLARVKFSDMNSRTALWVLETPSVWVMTTPPQEKPQNLPYPLGLSRLALPPTYLLPPPSP